MVDALSRIKEEQKSQEAVEQQLMVSDGIFYALSTVASQLLDSLRRF